MSSDRTEFLVIALVSGSHFVNHAYIVMLPPIIAILTDSFGVTIAAIGLAIGVQGAVNASLLLPFGHLSDARGRTLVLAISLVAGAVGATMVALAPTYGWLLVAQAVLGVGVAGHHPAHYPLLATATDPDRRSRAYSIHDLMGELGFAAPPAIVSAVLALGGDWRDALLLIAGAGWVYAVLAIIAVRLYVPREFRRGDANGTSERRPIASRVRSALSGVLASPPILTLALLALVVSAAAWGIRSFVVVLLTDGYGLGLGTGNLIATVMFATGGGLILLGGVLSDRIGPLPLLVAGFGGLVAVAGGLATGLLPLAVAGGVTLVLSGTITISRPARSTLADALSSRDDLGKSFAFVTIGISAGGAIAPPAFGWVVDRFGVEFVFAGVALLGLVALGVSLFLRRYVAQATITGAAN